MPMPEPDFDDEETRDYDGLCISCGAAGCCEHDQCTNCSKCLDVFMSERM
jgi:hypothetical protein